MRPCHLAAYPTGCVVVGSIIYASGHGRNMSGPGVKAKGKLGRDLTIEEGYATARAVALSMLSSRSRVFCSRLPSPQFSAPA